MDDDKEVTSEAQEHILGLCFLQEKHGETERNMENSPRGFSWVENGRRWHEAWWSGRPLPAKVQQQGNQHREQKRGRERRCQVFHLSSELGNRSRMALRLPETVTIMAAGELGFSTRSRSSSRMELGQAVARRCETGSAGDPQVLIGNPGMRIARGDHRICRDSVASGRGSESASFMGGRRKGVGC